MTDDATFERDLRAILAARDPGPAPASLAAAVRARLAADRELRWYVAIGRVAGAAAVVATLAAVLILAIVVARPIAVGPGASQGPLPTAPYELKAGDGVVAGTHDPVLQAIAVLLAFVGLLVLAARPVARRARIAAAIGCLAVAWLGLNVGTSDALGFVAGVNGVDPGIAGPDARPGVYAAVSGDSPFTVFVTVTNTSRLPLEIEGLTETRVPAGNVIPPRFVGLATLADWSSDVTTAPRIPFRPTTLAPGAEITLAVLGMAGQCAVLPRDPAIDGYTWIDHVGLVYEQLTIWHSTAFALPEPVNIYVTDRCP